MMTSTIQYRRGEIPGQEQLYREVIRKVDTSRLRPRASRDFPLSANKKKIGLLAPFLGGFCGATLLAWCGFHMLAAFDNLMLPVFETHESSINIVINGQSATAKTFISNSSHLLVIDVTMANDKHYSVSGPWVDSDIIPQLNIHKDRSVLTVETMPHYEMNGLSLQEKSIQWMVDTSTIGGNH